ncbi:hypothetical protein EP7_001125 [Isosphaeraceae bacterium EP7]
MCQVNSFALAVAPPSHRRSLHDQGIEEAERHKWIQSQKAGHDLGVAAIREWVRMHWNGFLRDRWIEHLEGVSYWIELDHIDFGLLRQDFHDSPLLDEILRRVKSGQENLEVINWAIVEGHDSNQVFEILLALDINGRRIECQLEHRLSAGGWA